MEQEGGVIRRGREIELLTDIDQTLEDFVEYFRTEFMINIPKNVQADKRLLSKYIRQFYRTRGSNESFRFLFRAIFNEEIEVYYPGDDILRVSDGRWVKESIIYVTGPFSTPLNEFIGKRVIGQTSGAEGRVQNVIGVILRGVPAQQFILESVIGEFDGGEIISTVDGDTATILASSGSITSVRVTDGGSFWAVDDSINLLGQSSGASASGTVISVNNETIDQGLIFRIYDGGRGYTVGNTVIDIVGGGGTGAAFTITDIANTELISTMTDTIEPVKNVFIDPSPEVQYGDSPSVGSPISANLAAATYTTTMSSLANNNVTVGSVNAIALVSAGKDYNSIPIVTITEPNIENLALADGTGGIKGADGLIVANNATGAILSIQILTSGGGFEDDEEVTLTGSTATTVVTYAEDWRNLKPGVSTTGATVSFTRTTQTEGEAVVTTSGNVILPGRYTDTKGLLSSDKKIQDSYYYQEFSYDIGSVLEFNVYKDIIKRALQPAGTAMFGTTIMNTLADVNARTEVEVVVDTIVLGDPAQGDLSIDGKSPTIAVS
jgi:hypothetical protein